MSALAEREPIVSIDDRMERRELEIERAADLDNRDSEHGGMRSLDVEIAEQARTESMRGWSAPYKAEVSAAELRAARRGEPAIDPRRVEVKRLRMDVRRAVARWSKLRGSDDRELLADDALYLLVGWPYHGSEPTAEHPRAELIDLGGYRAIQLARMRADRLKLISSASAALHYIGELESLRDNGSLPLRRDWLDTERRDRDGYPMLTRGAWRALHAVVKQALRSRFWRAEREHAEHIDPIGGMIDLDALIEQREQEQGEPENLPDSAAPEVIAELLAIPLDASRAIVAQSERRAHESGALRAQWQMSEASYPVAISRGAAIVRKRWPESAELIDALRELPRKYRELTERAVLLALLDFRNGYIERRELEPALVEYVSACGSLDDRARAHLGAARLALRRAGARYGSARAELIALSAERIIRAEDARKRRNGRLAPSAELACTYPEQRRESRKLSAAERRARADASAELERWTCGESVGKRYGDAERIAELRGILYPSWSHIAPSAELRADVRRERIEPRAALAELRAAPRAERIERAPRRHWPMQSGPVSAFAPAPSEPIAHGWRAIESGYSPRRYWGSPDHPVGRALYPR